MDNPLDSRFKTLSDGWQTFAQLPDRNAGATPRLCRWLLKSAEFWLVDTLLSYENSPDARIGGVFITLRSPCRSMNEYWLFLANEFTSWAGAYVSNEARASLDLRWESAYVAHEADAPRRFLAMLNEFARLIAPHQNGPLVLCLFPTVGTEPDVFSRFLFQLLSQSLPDSLRLLVRDEHEKPALNSLAKSLGRNMHSQFLDMQVPEYVSNITSGGNPQEPANRIRDYQKALALALAPNQKDIPEAERIAVDALKLCDEQKWHSLAASVHIALAYALFEENRNKEAITRYQQALDITEPAYKTGDSYAGYTSAIAWLGMASIDEHEGSRAKQEARYQQATERAMAVQEPIMAVQTLYMLAQLYRKWSKHIQEQEQYERIFTLAEGLTPTQRVYVKLPEIGAAYYKQQTTYHQRQTTLARLKNLLGENWEP
jgi:tetratricopeptide (TPR) repeat protein